MTREINKDSFAKEVLESQQPVALCFTAQWCGPCRLFAPTFDELGKECEKKAVFARIDIDESEEITKKYGVVEYPTVLLFVKGQVKSMSVGYVPKDTLKKWVDGNI